MPKVKLSFLVIIIFIIASFECFAASGINVSATVDKHEISLDEYLRLTIKIEGVDDFYKSPEIKLPPLEDDFTVVARSQSNSINVIGGNTQIGWQIQYSLLPKKEGVVKIESVEITYKGKIYATNKITITVTPSSTPRSREPSLKKDSPKKVPWSRKEGTTI